MYAVTKDIIKRLSKTLSHEVCQYYNKKTLNYLRQFFLIKFQGKSNKFTFGGLLPKLLLKESSIFEYLLKNPQFFK